MGLKEQIKVDMVSAFKGGDTFKKNFLKVVLGEFSRNEDAQNPLTDERALAIMAKMVKNAKIIGNEESENEIAILENYLPKQLTWAEMVAELEKIIDEVSASSPRDMGRVLGVLQNKFKGRVDNKIAAEWVKKRLKS